jgi:hypothetical protein
MVGLLDGNHAMPAVLKASTTAIPMATVLVPEYSSHTASPTITPQDQDDNEWTSDDDNNLSDSNGLDLNHETQEKNRTRMNAEISSPICVILFGAWAVLCFLVAMAVWAMAFHEQLPRDQPAEPQLYYYLHVDDQMLADLI